MSDRRRQVTHAECVLFADRLKCPLFEVTCEEKEIVQVFQLIYLQIGLKRNLKLYICPKEKKWYDGFMSCMSYGP